ncbi:MAG: hypothetical protein EG826_07555 [Deltaproteobacteria bacterium]|nr:hypothetical protein [Deltaproteobacteria bacterium]
MSLRKLPDYRLKQKILYIDKTPAATLISYGDLYMEDGALSDALDFYTKASHRTGMQKIKDLALEKGDAFLFRGAAKSLNIELRDADWKDLGRRAMDQKKYLFARQALENAHDAEALNALAAVMKAEEAKQSA